MSVRRAKGIHQSAIYSVKIIEEDIKKAWVNKELKFTQIHTTKEKEMEII